MQAEVQPLPGVQPVMVVAVHDHTHCTLLNEYGLQLGEFIVQEKLRLRGDVAFFFVFHSENVVLM